jgi:hypothetical protein
LAGYPRISSVAAFVPRSDNNNNNNNDDDIDDMDNQQSSYVLLMLQAGDGDAPGTTTASCLEVLDVTALAQQYGAHDERSIALDDYWVLPQAGRELTNVVRTTQNRPAAVWIPSHGSHVVTAFGVGRLLVEVADGSVCLITGSVAHNGTLSWGLTSRSTCSQYLLRYPSVGRGIVTLGEAQPTYAACALRGGTVYLFSLDETNDDDNDECSSSSRSSRPSEVICCTYPDDVAADRPFQHLQAFTAGNLRFSTTSEAHSTTLPLLCFAWPGGIVEVYSAHLMEAAAPVPESLTSLVENGTVEDLRRLLGALEPTDALLLKGDGVWTLARKEVAAWKTPDLPLLVSDLAARSLVSFRALLVELADPSSAAHA